MTLGLKNSNMDFLFENVLACYIRFRFTKNLHYDVLNDYKMLELCHCTDNEMDVSCGICGLNTLK